VAETGLTAFKKNSEYIICGILFITIYFLFKNEKEFERTVFRLLLWSIICTIISELAFTFYISNYGISNIVGHYFKIFSVAFVYIAIIKNCIETPYDIIFRELSRVNAELQKTLDEIKTLRGIIPICAYCKKIRDDKGAWDAVEYYVSKHSYAQFSHGACPECFKKEMEKIDKED
jgi:hypothetical protein